MSKKKEIMYIVGAVSADPDWEPKFKRAKKFMEAKGYHIISPLDYPKGLTQEHYMQMSVVSVFQADLLYALPDWIRSPGAKAEVMLADSISKKVIQPAEWPPA